MLGLALPVAAAAAEASLAAWKLELSLKERVHLDSEQCCQRNRSPCLQDRGDRSHQDMA